MLALRGDGAPPAPCSRPERGWKARAGSDGAPCAARHDGATQVAGSARWPFATFVLTLSITPASGVPANTLSITSVSVLPPTKRLHAHRLGDLREHLVVRECEQRLAEPTLRRAEPLHRGVDLGLERGEHERWCAARVSVSSAAARLAGARVSAAWSVSATRVARDVAACAAPRPARARPARRRARRAAGRRSAATSSSASLLAVSARASASPRAIASCFSVISSPRRARSSVMFACTASCCASPSSSAIAASSIVDVEDLDVGDAHAVLGEPHARPLALVVGLAEDRVADRCSTDCA